jgi:hypothetical protein
MVRLEEKSQLYKNTNSRKILGKLVELNPQFLRLLISSLRDEQTTLQSNSKKPLQDSHQAQFHKNLHILNLIQMSIQVEKVALNLILK